MERININLSFFIPFGILFSLFFVAWLFFFVSHNYLVGAARKLTKNISGFWVKTFIDDRFLTQLSWLLPVSIIFGGTSLIQGLPHIVTTLVERVSLATIVVLVLRAVTILLGNANAAYTTLEISRVRPIKGLIQVALIVLHLLALILVISVLLDKSPWFFLSGLGAMTAILLLVFRDTLLSLVAGFQLTSQNLVSVGDWIELPQFGADGDVVDIALHAVRIQNWDKTITVIPTHKFLEHSFKNWRGMQESGGRRIKRAVYIDISSVRFLSSQEIENLERFNLLKDYLKKKESEIKEFNLSRGVAFDVNSRRLTNLGTFRAYLVCYLRQHPRINQQMTFLIRQLEPGSTGLPIEIYVFTNDIRWSAYEDIQADIFDHILAIVPEFGLRVFQSPSGYDFKGLVKDV
ncbi:MAG: mechanosensitive ion channel family protein [Bacteriovoracia bacterium]